MKTGFALLFIFFSIQLFGQDKITFTQAIEDQFSLENTVLLIEKPYINNFRINFNKYKSEIPREGLVQLFSNDGSIKYTVIYYSLISDDNKFRHSNLKVSNHIGNVLHEIDLEEYSSEPITEIPFSKFISIDTYNNDYNPWIPTGPITFSRFRALVNNSEIINIEASKSNKSTQATIKIVNAFIENYFEFVSTNKKELNIQTSLYDSSNKVNFNYQNFKFLKSKLENEVLGHEYYFLNENESPIPEIFSNYQSNWISFVGTQWPEMCSMIFNLDSIQ